MGKLSKPILFAILISVGGFIYGIVNHYFFKEEAIDLKYCYQIHLDSIYSVTAILSLDQSMDYLKYYEVGEPRFPNGFEMSHNYRTRKVLVEDQVEVLDYRDSVLVKIRFYNTLYDDFPRNEFETLEGYVPYEFLHDRPHKLF